MSEQAEKLWRQINSVLIGSCRTKPTELIDAALAQAAADMRERCVWEADRLIPEELHGEHNIAARIAIANVIGWPAVLIALQKSPELERRLHAEFCGIDRSRLLPDAVAALENVGVQFGEVEAVHV